MSTVNKAFADNLVANNGFYDGDSNNDLGDNPRVIRIVEYSNAWGDLAYGITFEHQDKNKYLRKSTFINNPVIYWEYKASAK